LSDEQLKLDEAPAVEERDEKYKQDSVMMGSELRGWWVTKIMKPIEDICIRLDIHPNTITLIGFIFNVFVGFLYLTGHFLWAGWVLIFAASFDFLDGRIARITNRVSATGGYLDSILDRYIDVILFGSLATYYRDTFVYYFALGAILGTFMVSYTKAKAESMGIECDVGLMQRPERIVMLGLGSIVSSIFQIAIMPFYGPSHNPPQYLLILIIIIMAVLTNLTALHRIHYTWEKLRDVK
jgi:CDP-diacylglycerol---glycerol-3-phosphate 3-phosphatidyltransferase